MSVERRSPQTPSDDQAAEDDQSADDRSADQPSTAESDVELEYRSPGEYSPGGTSRPQSTADGSQSATAVTADASDAPLSHRIERTKLQARVTALERALETSEYRQHEIVTQYERLLAERTDDADATRAERQRQTAANENDGDERDEGLLKRLLERWR